MGDSVLPTDSGQLVGPTSIGQTLSQVRQLLVWDLDPKGRGFRCSRGLRGSFAVAHRWPTPRWLLGCDRAAPVRRPSDLARHRRSRPGPRHRVLEDRQHDPERNPEAAEHGDEPSRLEAVCVLGAAIALGRFGARPSLDGDDPSNPTDHMWIARLGFPPTPSRDRSNSLTSETTSQTTEHCRPHKTTSLGSLGMSVLSEP
jgi:hypothetical protein